MSYISLFVRDSILYYLDQLTEKREKKEDNRLAWPSAINGCHKQDALRRAKGVAVEFSPETRIKMMVGTLVGEFVANAMIEGGIENALTVTTEEPVKTDKLSGKLDIMLRGAGVNSVIEVKYTTYFPPGFAARNLYQIAAYMQSLQLTHGVLCIIYTGGGFAMFDVNRKHGAYWVTKTNFHDTTFTDEPVGVKDFSDMPTDNFGYVCLTDEQLSEQIQDAKFWLDNAVENTDHAMYTCGPIMNAERIPFYCATAKLPEPYKTNRPGGAKIGDKKPGSGTLKCNCPFFDSCYGGIIEGSNRVQEGKTYEYDQHWIGSEIHD